MGAFFCFNFGFVFKGIAGAEVGGEDRLEETAESEHADAERSLNPSSSSVVSPALLIETLLASEVVRCRRIIEGISRES